MNNANYEVKFSVSKTRELINKLKNHVHALASTYQRQTRPPATPSEQSCFQYQAASQFISHKLVQNCTSILKFWKYIS